MPFLATIPMTMINPMKDATLKVVPVMRRAKMTPAVERTEETRMEAGAEKLRNSARSTP